MRRVGTPFAVLASISALVGLLSLVALQWLAVLQPPGSPDSIVRSGHVLSTASLAFVVGIRAELLCQLFVFLFWTSLVCLDGGVVSVAQRVSRQQAVP